MIIRKISDNTYTITTQGREGEAIDWLMTSFPHKFERFLEKYLSERQVNMEYQEGHKILQNMTPSEKQNFKQRVRNK